MSKRLLAAAAALAIILPVAAEETAAPSPGEIVAAAPASDWVAIAPDDLLVMDLAPAGKGRKAKPRRVVIQLMPAPFSQGWIGNIRKLAAVHWWDGTSVNRVQDNYVAQWGDATEKKALPEGLAVVPESDYVAALDRGIDTKTSPAYTVPGGWPIVDPYIAGRSTLNTGSAAFVKGWAVGFRVDDGVPQGGSKQGRLGSVWPVHCYAMVGVGRNMSPDTGSGAELYAVIGHAPRHLDRNIALVGRVVSGIEHLSSLPRGTGDLGFYEDPKERVAIRSVRLASDLPAAHRPRLEYLSTDSDSFARYADARANRRDPFFIRPAGGADICNIPVPIRPVAVK